MTHEMSETARLARLRAVEEHIPEEARDRIKPLGTLAGPVSPDRPPVPVWEYMNYAAEHPGITEDHMAGIRFPLRLHDGTLMVTSISEMVPGNRPTPTFGITVADVVHLYQLMHDSGAVLWNASKLEHEEVKPASEYRTEVYAAWRAGLRHTDQE
ncbi:MULTISPECIES: hypothetical protein [Arthrobacter]|uniref:Uncharacterized protein n=1 Tax=Arthrobacter terricola TaxID=2547396 RepID=A0A4R5KB78_9MICC|nr:MULTISPECIES: hypothetical protein [Arthrobacter]MBT8163037.1 hypothetical protein [Arthrobacter sp. GN70]TDF91758.1 hypothetical protein E1809_19765 [Arthrobacter terricola]